VVGNLKLSKHGYLPGQVKVGDEQRKRPKKPMSIASKTAVYEVFRLPDGPLYSETDAATEMAGVVMTGSAALLQIENSCAEVR
jgi:hypothetical protein